MQGSTSTELRGVRKVLVLLLPWTFLAMFALLYLNFLWPRATSGHVLAVGFGAFVAIVFTTCLVAAITFSRDVVTGRYP